MKLDVIIIVSIWILVVTVSGTSGMIKGCGVSYANRVVGGENAMAGEFPFVVALFMKQGDNSQYNLPNLLCGGSLISDKFVLTAAHCFDDTAGAAILVRLGAFNIDKESLQNPAPPVDISAEHVIVHEEYDQQAMRNDIAIIKLKNPVTFSMFTQPICLPTNNANNFVGTNATVAGWGKTSFSGMTSQLLQKVNLKVVSVAQCNRAYSRIGIAIESTKICAGFIQGKKDSCQGDSGGPLMAKINNVWAVIGIVSHGYKCAEPGFYGVYTRVTDYVDWIMKHVK